MKKVAGFVGLGFIAGLVGCSHWQLVPVKEIEEKNSVEMTLVSGNTMRGEIISIEDEHVRVLTDNGKAYRVPLQKIAEVKRRPPVYDEAGTPITEREISDVKNHHKLTLYTVGGTALSFGASFFLGSMVQRNLQEDDTDTTPRWAITGVGTALGGTLFAIAGNKKDRQNAIEAIRELRAEDSREDLAKVRARKEDTDAELERIRNEREAQDREIEALKKKIENAKKKGNSLQ
jgi:hypothetical protein